MILEHFEILEEDVDEREVRFLERGPPRHLLHDLARFAREVCEGERGGVPGACAGRRAGARRAAGQQQVRVILRRLVGRVDGVQELCGGDITKVTKGLKHLTLSFLPVELAKHCHPSQSHVEEFLRKANSSHSLRMRSSLG